MKKSSLYVSLTAVLMVVGACGSAKKVVTETVVETKEQKEETFAISGIEMGKSLNEDGTKIIERPFVWFSGSSSLDNRQAAIQMAEAEARAAVSRTLSNAVKTQAKSNNKTVSERVLQAAEFGWEQIGSSIANGCKPFGDAKVVLDKRTGVYTATVKVAMRGDLYNKALEKAQAGIKAPDDLTKEEAEKFIELNEMILGSLKMN